MCGIFGTFGFSDQKLMKKMGDVIRHRGPDEHGVFTDDNIGLGSVRLSIIDLRSGRQPIHNEDRSLWIVYNGEVYNFPALKKELEKKHRFYTNTDTEVLLHAYEEHGLGFLDKMNGMFSFAIWDSVKKRLVLARDRMGIKPLYYHADDGRLVFASEIKSILEYGMEREVEPRAVYRFLALKYTPGDITMFRGIRKLPPGHLLICDKKGFRVKKYWDTEINPRQRPISVYKKRLREIMEDSVEKRLISDVPLGAFLSGGIDSSIIVGLMSRFSDRLKTFTVGFDVQDYSEIEYSRMVSEKFGTDNHEIILEADKFMKILPKVIWHFDEPISDAAAIPTFYLSRLASQKVKVVLTGEGGDEVFGGYDKYNPQRRETVFRYYSMLPGPLRALVKRTLPEKHSSYLRAAEKSKRTYLVPNNAYAERIERHTPAKGLVDDLNSVFNPHVRKADRLAEMSYIDFKTWLPEEILMKTDKMTMANSLEARVPYLDHEMVNFSMTIPSSYKIRAGVHKYILRETFSDVLPEPIRGRRKWGFNVPLELWQKSMVRDLEDGSTASDFMQDYVNSGYMRKRINSGDAQFLFSLLTINLWKRIFIDNEKPEKVLP